MPIYNIYLFNRKGLLLYYREWKRDRQNGMDRSEEGKLFFGMLLSLKSFAERMSSREGYQTIRFFKTSAYKCSYLESPTGLIFALNAHPEAHGGNELLQEIYKLYVDTVIKNPLANPEDPIDNELFTTRLDAIVTKHSAFA
ncbi:unnamed protein product, partial [Mesorhabditis spiculigera]